MYSCLSGFSVLLGSRGRCHARSRTGASGTALFTSPPPTRRRALSGTAAVREHVLIEIHISELPGTSVSGRLFPGRRGRLGARKPSGHSRKQAGSRDRPEQLSRRAPAPGVVFVRGNRRARDRAFLFPGCLWVERFRLFSDIKVSGNALRRVSRVTWSFSR